MGSLFTECGGQEKGPSFSLILPLFFLLFFFFFLSLSFSLPGWEKVQTVYRLMRTILYRRENGRCSWILDCEMLGHREQVD